jgi:uncharacterized membrane protein
MSEQIIEIDTAHKNVALLVYALQGLGFFTGGLTFIAALVVNYVKLDEVKDTWLESHFRWQINTFWYGLLWWAIAMLFWLVLMGWLASAIVSIWMVYRIIRGALYLNDSKPIIF